jgi:deoxyxylulose-5-phosphate synthase
LTTKAKAKKQDITTDPITVGNAVFIRTVTMNHVGRIKSIKKGAILLEDAAWVAETGARVGEFLATGKLKGQYNAEIERTPGTVRVNPETIIDAFHWMHALPLESQ